MTYKVDDLIPACASLCEREKKAISDFSLIWSYFESRVLDTNANLGSIEKTAVENGTLANEEQFLLAFSHFQSRYVTDGETNPKFDELKAKNIKYKKKMSHGLCEGKPSDSEKLLSVLLVIYRLRNNLFHGTKWESGIEDQLENFNYSIAVMSLFLCSDDRT